jgi:hypothetical protein
MLDVKSFDALIKVVSALKGLDRDCQNRILKAVATFLDTPGDIFENLHIENPSVDQKTKISSFKEKEIQPKDFLDKKRPKTDIERIVCLAYYLMQHRGKKSFKTVDLSGLNLEAAQPKLSNPTVAITNAIKKGMLMHTSAGLKQITLIGENFVNELPDRQAAVAKMTNQKINRKVNRANSQRENAWNN